MFDACFQVLKVPNSLTIHFVLEVAPPEEIIGCEIGGTEQATLPIQRPSSFSLSLNNYCHLVGTDDRSAGLQNKG